jgi:polysaccharide biosynthesis protein PslH
MKILILSPVHPYPPADGDRIRIFNIIKQLKETGRHKLHLVTFCRKGEEQNNKELNKYFDSIETIQIGKNQLIKGAIKGIFSSMPLNAAAYSDKRMKIAVERAATAIKPDLLFVYRLRMAQYAKDLSMPKVIDYVDSLALFMKRSAGFESALIKRLYYMFDYARVEKYERKIASDYKAVFINSDEDAKYLGNKNIITASNGAIQASRKATKKNLVYTAGFMGNMPYGPNKEAMNYFIKKVWKKNFNNDKNIRLVIAGFGAEKFAKLIKSDNIEFKGRVEDVRKEVSSWDMSVVPVRYGAGRQNKIMDCWACMIPVVAAPFAASGVHGADGINILIAKDTGEFVEKINRLRSNAGLGKKISIKAAATLKEHFNWKKTGIIINKAVIKSAK